MRGATKINFLFWVIIACFNPRPCARGDTLIRIVNLRRYLSFNPRPCARGDYPPIGSLPNMICFNPRPCARGDVYDGLHILRRIHGFNPRPCARGDFSGAGSSLIACEFQSTPLCEGRH